MKTTIKYVLIIIGTISLGLGLLGMILPLLPTTPFFLLTTACYMKGSKKFYNWLISNKLFGSYLSNYINNKGIPLKTKIYAIVLLWTSITYCVVFMVSIFAVRLLLLVIAICVTVHIITIKTLYKGKKAKETRENEDFLPSDYF